MQKGSEDLPSAYSTGVEYFGTQAGQWRTLYESKPAFRDRLSLFLGGLTRSVSAPGVVLDFGCGPGVMSFALAEMGYTVEGVDGSPRMIETARAEQKRLCISGVRFRVLDASALDLEPNSCDAVICSSVLQYVQDDERLLADLARTVRPGGTMLISVPYRGSLLGLVEDASARLLHADPSSSRAFMDHSLRRYWKGSLLAFLSSQSMESFECTHFEVPLLGRVGIPLSRVGVIGVMLLVAARKSVGGATADIHPSKGVKRPNGAELATQRRFSRRRLWEQTPWRVKRALQPVISCLPTKFWLGRRFRDTVEFIRRAEWWDPEQARHYQLAQLRRISSLAYESSPFYRKRMDDCGFEPGDLKSLDDFRGLPLTDRDTVLREGIAMCTRGLDAHGIESVATGGTSGVPLKFVINANRSAVEYAYLIAGWARAGYTLSTPQAVLRGEVIPKDIEGLRHRYDPLLRRHYYSVFHMTDENMRRYMEHISTLDPCYLLVYPSSGVSLARFVERSGDAAPDNILGVLAGSEILFPEDRAKIERVLDSRCFSWYGHSEKLVMGAECEHSDHCHVWPTYGYFELLDETGQPVSEPGNRGEIVGTGFINTVMPFIRYKTGDFAEFVADRCDRCGRAHPLIRDIRGHRTQEMLVASDGSLIPWTAMNMHDGTFDLVRQLQFVQSAPGIATLKIVPVHGLREENLDRIRRNLDQKLKGRLKFDIDLVDAIPLTLNGKSTFVDQKLDLDDFSSRGIKL